MMSRLFYQEGGKAAGRFKADFETITTLSVIAGASEFAAGTGLEAGGMAASVGSGGTLAAVGIPVSAGGLALATAGAAVAAKSATSFMADMSKPIQTPVNTKGLMNFENGKNKVMLGTEGPFSPRSLTEKEKHLYRRAKIRKKVEDKIWESNKDEYGDVRDPLTKQIMRKDEPWDKGHKPGFEHYKHRQSAVDRKISRKQFRDECNDYRLYRPELPSSNRCHKGEGPPDVYCGY